MAREAGSGGGAEEAPEGRATPLRDEAAGASVPEDALFAPATPGDREHAVIPSDVGRPDDTLAAVEPTDDGRSAPEASVAGDLSATRGEVASEHGQGEPAAPSMASGSAERPNVGSAGDLRDAPLPGAWGRPRTVEDRAISSASDIPAFAASSAAPSGSAVPPPAASLADASPAVASEGARAGGSPPSAPAPRRRGGFGAGLLGGLLVSALALGAAWAALDRGLLTLPLPDALDSRLAALETREPEAPAVDPAALEALGARLNEAEARLAALDETLAALPEPAPAADLAPLREELAQGLATAQARTEEIAQRLAALESRPEPAADAPAAGPALEAPAGAGAAPADTAALAGLREETAALASRLGALEAAQADPAALEEAQARLSALEEVVARLETGQAALGDRLSAAEAQGAAAAEEAQAIAARAAEAETRAAEAETEAARRAALAELAAALESGAPFAPALETLAAAGAEPPAALAVLAAEGAPTLPALRESFPDAARAGLAAAREQGLLDEGAGWGTLRRWLSVRSTEPRAGGDPDAVLSRAEADLRSGGLGAALEEIATLPEPVRAAMADWTARAEARAAALAALETLGTAP